MTPDTSRQSDGVADLVARAGKLRVEEIRIRYTGAEEGVWEWGGGGKSFLSISVIIVHVMEIYRPWL